MALQLVRTDVGYDSSNIVGIPLVGNVAHHVPSAIALDGVAISTTSWDPAIGLANVETVLANDGTAVHRIDGQGFENPVVNVFTASGNCGPLAPMASTSTTVDFELPPSCPTGPGSLQVVNTTTYRASNALSAPIGAAVTIGQVDLVDGTVIVHGTGFSSLTVINLFANDGDTLSNLGGLGDGGEPRIPLSLTDATELTFPLPPGAGPGPAFVEAINPPFIPFASSGTGSAGSFSIP